MITREREYGLTSVDDIQYKNDKNNNKSVQQMISKISLNRKPFFRVH